MRGKTLGLLCLYLIFLSVFVSTGKAQKASPIIGRWDLTVQGADAPYTSWLEVTDAGGKLQGRFVGRFGSARPIKQIEFNDGKLKFSLPPQYENMKVDLVFDGKLIGAKLEGSTNGEDGAPLKWSGARAPALNPKAEPKWGAPVQLFNGKDLTGWKLRSEKGKGCWSVEDGAMTNSQGCVDIITEQNFHDFKLSLEFKLADPQANGGRPSNSGVYLRGRYETQIEDTYGKEPESHGMGGLYGFLTPKVNASKKSEEWQKYEITLIGRRLTVTLNGQTVIDKEEIPGITGGALDSAEEKPGPIMLQGDHGKIWFRNIVLTPAK
jgi:3-keto-disaccharide hydrolase